MQHMNIPKPPSGYLRMMEMIRGILLIADTQGTILWLRSFLHNIPETFFSSFAGKKWNDVFISAPSSGPLRFEEIIRFSPKEKISCVNCLPLGKEEFCFLEWQLRFVRAKAGYVLAAGQSITERIQNEEELRREHAALIKRNRELSCLYGIAQIMGNPELDFSGKLQMIVRMLPQAFRFPEMASARIRLDQRTFSSPGQESAHSPCILTERILINGKQRGMIRAAYSQEPAPLRAGEPVFLKEEQNLLRTVAKQLALILEKKEGDIRKDELENQLHHADRLAKVGQLSAGLAHEINNPLNSILGFAQLAAKTEGLPEQVAEDLEKIVKSALHAREIIKKLMLFSRQMPHQEKKISLSAVTEEGLYFIEHICTKGRVTVIRELAENLPEITADPSQINQVVMNLVMNAVHAMPEGGTLTVKTCRDAGHICLIVRDTGIGMDRKTLRQIFLPFFTTKDVNQGTGMGLAVVHGIVEAHGASIHVESQAGKGSAFTIRFPLPL
ncbi:MAG: ATP-binding protein [Desulfobacterales bacterium]